MTLYSHTHSADDPHPFSPYLAALGRGPGRSRSLTRDEAFEAMSMVLDGRADPIQVGAFLLLLRYRAENPDEITGLVEAVRHHAGLSRTLANTHAQADLDWPSYAAGRTRGAPWFLLSALLVARSGVRVALHGFNSHLSAGTLTEEAMAALGLPVATSREEAAVHCAQNGLSYLPLRHFDATAQSLLSLRPVLGLRTAVNTVARLINPLNAPTSFIGIFHPPYLDVQLESARLMGSARTGVIRGGGGEAERNPFKPCALNLSDEPQDASRHDWPALLDKALGPKPEPRPLDRMMAVWRGALDDPVGRAMVTGTAAQALVVARRAEKPGAAQALADRLWDGRLKP